MTRSAAAELLAADATDRAPRRAALLLGAAGSAAAGAVLGGSSGDVHMLVFAAIKVPLLLLAATLLCLPSLYVFHTVLGLHTDLGAVARGIFAAEASLGLTLGALAPVLIVASVSLTDPYLLTLLDGLAFLVATAVAQRVLARHYRPLIARDPRHKQALRSWLLLFAFAGIQMAWVLRPFRGTPGFPVEFLRAEAFEQNAYVVLLEHFLRLGR